MAVCSVALQQSPLCTNTVQQSSLLTNTVQQSPLRTNTVQQSSLCAKSLAAADADVELLRVAFDGATQPESDEEYEVNNLLFVGMLRTMRDGESVASSPVIVGFAALVLKAVLLTAFIFKFYIAAVPNSETWGAVLDDYADYDRAGILASLVAAPAYLLKKLSGSSEFRDSAVFRATLRTLYRSDDGGNAPLFALWSLVDVFRTYLILPTFIVANAALIGFSKDFNFVLSNTFFAGLVLEIDEYFYYLFSEFGGTVAEADSRVRLGTQTRAACDRVVRNKVILVGGTELALVGLMKTELAGGVELLWAVPVIAATLSQSYGPFPNSPPERATQTALLVVTLGAWLLLVSEAGGGSLLGSALVGLEELLALCDGRSRLV